jgi:alpha-tubulin suppressor-like RCC1 family protein
MGALHTCALNGGDAFCWGSDLQGQLGDGTMMTGSLMPLAAVGVATPVTLLSAGGAYTCAGGAGGIQCWGFNADGQLGNGSMSDSLSPVSPTF